jgi:hypothetical protein
MQRQNCVPEAHTHEVVKGIAYSPRHLCYMNLLVVERWCVRGQTTQVGFCHALADGLASLQNKIQLSNNCTTVRIDHCQIRLME